MNPGLAEGSKRSTTSRASTSAPWGCTSTLPVLSSTKNGTARAFLERVSDPVCLEWCEPGVSSEEEPEERTTSRVTAGKLNRRACSHGTQTGRTIPSGPKLLSCGRGRAPRQMKKQTHALRP